MRGQATILLARRAPTIKRWSLDARSEGQFACPPVEKVKNQKGLTRRPRSKAPHALARLGIEMEKRIRMDARSGRSISPIPEEMTSELGTLHARRCSRSE